MAPHRRPRSFTGFFIVHARIYDTFTMDIYAGGKWVSLSTYRTASRGHGVLNFPEIQSHAEAVFLAPSPLIETACKQRRHERTQLWLSITEVDERGMEEWRRLYPTDVDYELTFWANKAAENRRRRAARAEKRHEKRFIEA
jgi:hypothetical protein